MTDPFRILYETLLSGIDDIEKKHSKPEKQIESCFHLSENIRREVDKIVALQDFKNENDEIVFFKSIKPIFTSLVEFYSILYRAELFIPEAKADKIEFWNYELQRAQLFITRHELFFSYIRQGDGTRDREYFLRTSPGDISAPHDELIAKLIARDKYLNYINAEILPGLNDINP